MNRESQTRLGGWTVVEAVIALALGAIVTHVVVQSLLATHRIEAVLRTEVEKLSTLRVARGAIGRDLSHGSRGSDWQSYPPDSISLRAYRGIGVVCGALTAADTLYLGWSGLRNPNARKDSVSLLDENGNWEDFDLAADRAVNERCPADSTLALRRWTLDPAPAVAPVLARLWERGSYHVVDTVLSYRSRPRKSLASKGNRQPISPASLQTPGTMFVDRAGVLSLALHGRDSTWSGLIRLGGSW